MVEIKYSRRYSNEEIMDITEKINKHLNEATKMPTKLSIGAILNLPNHTIKITNIYIDSFHKNKPEVYITYSWVDKADGNKGTSNMSIEALKNVIKVN